MNLLVGIDHSQSTGKFVDTVRNIIGEISAKVWLLHVADPEPDFVGFDASPSYDRNIRAKQFHTEHLDIQSIAAKWRADGLDATALLVQGATAQTILKEASKIGADIIVVGSHGRGAIHRLLVGSVSEEVLRKAECPVLVIPTHERTQADRN